MELNGAVPHYVIWPEPGEWPAKKDAQLTKAIDVLKRDVKRWQARPRPDLVKASQRQAPLAESIGWNDAGKRGAVAAGRPEAVAAGLEILQRGGNAIDAAVATLLALSVTDYGSFAIGGEVPLFKGRRHLPEKLLVRLVT